MYKQTKNYKTQCINGIDYTKHKNSYIQVKSKTTIKSQNVLKYKLSNYDHKTVLYKINDSKCWLKITFRYENIRSIKIQIYKLRVKQR